MAGTLTGRPRGISATGRPARTRSEENLLQRSHEELTQSAVSPTVHSKLVSRNRMLERILGDQNAATRDENQIEDIGIMVHGWGLLFVCVMVGGCLLGWLLTCGFGGGEEEVGNLVRLEPFAEFWVGEYYGMMAVMYVPVFVLFVYWNWLSMKIFVHN
eukprot:TRINITY_DN23509_c0_g1_i10.p1 TRINITY_DN23509_c0_g1~~TRINITY_DN23509_c0_g1_i10.p1  ORF type:complete len:158 (+),score=31.58 TRINITY_DN23509_c0_g1_i10:253-726(+)